jgi:hypothetical protein
MDGGNVERDGAGSNLSVPLIALMRGVIYRDDDEMLWQWLLDQQARIRDYVAVLGLEPIIDEGEGYAFLRQHPPAEGETELPRLVPRRQLSYPVSLLLALLRKRLAEFDAAGGETRLILSREDMFEMIRLFLPATGNEARLMDRLDAHINKVVDMGLLRRLRGQTDQFEVGRILKSFVDAQWMSEFDRRLAVYAAHVAGAQSSEDEAP